MPITKKKDVELSKSSSTIRGTTTAAVGRRAGGLAAAAGDARTARGRA